MQAPPFLSADDLAALVPMRDAIEAIRDAYRVRERPVERTQVPVAGGDLLVMPAVDGGAAGVKVVMVQPANRARGGPVIQGVYVLIDGASGAPVALLDGGALTRLRTPAASAVATDVLARHDSCSLGVVGTGPQAHGHVTAILVARPGLVDVRIAARTASAAHELVDRLRAAGVAARAVGIDVAAAADIVCTCTSSPTPLFASAAVADGAHLNVVGSYRPERREVDAALVRRAHVVVDDLDAARAEAGDLVLAEREAGWSFADVRGDLTALCLGEVTRADVGAVTLFKSVGLARQDLVVALLAARRAGLLGAR